MDKVKKIITYLLLIFLFAISILFTVINLQECVAYSDSLALTIEWIQQSGIEDPIIYELRSCVIKFAIYGSLGILSAISCLLIAIFIGTINDVKNAIFLISEFQNKRLETKEAKIAAAKQARIKHLQNELEELKKD